jgi:hypothetical protein
VGHDIRKATRIGPARLNRSRHGLGEPRGHAWRPHIGRSSQGRAYVQGGRGGLYYPK